jgi:hypothetical protein
MDVSETIQCNVQRFALEGGIDADTVYVQVQWVPFFDTMHVLGRVGYDLVSESADFHFEWHAGPRVLMVHPPYRWLKYDTEYEIYGDRFAYINEQDIGRVPYYRFPRSKDGTTLIEILEVLFASRGGLPQRIVLL